MQSYFHFRRRRSWRLSGNPCLPGFVKTDIKELTITCEYSREDLTLAVNSYGAKIIHAPFLKK
jgi:hypothetical protein